MDKWYKNIKVDEKDGCFNKIADKVPRKDTFWSDTNFDDDRFANEFERLKCKICGGCSFNVLSIEDTYETVAQCTECGMYYIVHSG